MNFDGETSRITPPPTSPLGCFGESGASPSLKPLLLAGGWFSGRKVAVTTLTQQVEQAGFHLFPRARGVLEELGSLTIQSVRQPSNLFYPQDVTFNPCEVDGQYDRLGGWREELRNCVFPLGSYGNDSLVLLAECGAVFLAYGYDLWPVNVQFEGGLETLLLANQRPKWWKPTDYRLYCDQHNYPLGTS